MLLCMHEYEKKIYLCDSLLPEAGVMKLVDMLDLGSSASRLGGSSPSTRTHFFPN